MSRKEGGKEGSAGRQGEERKDVKEGKKGRKDERKEGKKEGKEVNAYKRACCHSNTPLIEGRSMCNFPCTQEPISRD
jgi:hypothetical protein